MQKLTNAFFTTQLVKVFLRPTHRPSGHWGSLSVHCLPDSYCSTSSSFPSRSQAHELSIGVMPSYAHIALGCTFLLAVAAAIPAPVPFTPESPQWGTPGLGRTSALPRSDSSRLRSALRYLRARPPVYDGQPLKDLTPSEMRALGLASADATITQAEARGVKRREAKARWAGMKRQTLRKEVKRPKRFQIEQPRQGF